MDTTGRYRNTERTLSAFLMYENVVEYVESLSPGATFTQRDIWHALGRGHRQLTYVRTAVRDMRLHGLLECVKVTRHGKCLRMRRPH